MLFDLMKIWVFFIRVEDKLKFWPVLSCSVIIELRGKCCIYKLVKRAQPKVLLVTSSSLKNNLLYIKSFLSLLLNFLEF